MQALVKTKPEYGALELQSVELPKIKHDDEVLIKIHQAAICGTDIHIYKWDKWAASTIKTPMHIGHEFYGKVVAVGDNIKHLKIGDRVSAEGHITCGRCRNCLGGSRFLCPNAQGIGVNIPGAFAEYIVMPSENVFALPDCISDDVASIMDPYGNAVHSALSFPCHGEDVLITGAGPVGILAALICQHLRARHVVLTDVNDNRLNLAKSLGIKHCVNVGKVDLSEVKNKLGLQEGFDINLEMSGNVMALNSAIKHMVNGGKIAQLGVFNDNTVGVNLNDIVFKGIFLKGIYGREIFSTWYKMVTLIESGLNIDQVITHKFHYRDYQNAFETMLSGNSGKIILEWN